MSYSYSKTLECGKKQLVLAKMSLIRTGLSVPTLGNKRLFFLKKLNNDYSFMEMIRKVSKTCNDIKLCKEAIRSDVDIWLNSFTILMLF